MRRQLTEHERAQRREADRQRSLEAVQALKTSDGWQAWLACRQHFHDYSLVISGSHVIDALCKSQPSMTCR